MFERENCAPLYAWILSLSDNISLIYAMQLTLVFQCCGCVFAPHLATQKRFIKIYCDDSTNSVYYLFYGVVHLGHRTSMITASPTDIRLTASISSPSLLFAAAVADPRAPARRCNNVHHSLMRNWGLEPKNRICCRCRSQFVAKKYEKLCYNKRLANAGQWTTCSRTLVFKTRIGLY